MRDRKRAIIGQAKLAHSKGWAIRRSMWFSRVAKSCCPLGAFSIGSRNLYQDYQDAIDTAMRRLKVPQSFVDGFMSGFDGTRTYPKKFLSMYYDTKAEHRRYLQAHAMGKAVFQDLKAAGVVTLKKLKDEYAQ